MANASHTPPSYPRHGFHFSVLITAVLAIISLLLILYSLTLEGQAAGVPTSTLPATNTQQALAVVPPASPTLPPTWTPDSTLAPVDTLPPPPTATAAVPPPPPIRPTDTATPLYLPNQFERPTATAISIPLPTPEGTISWTLRVPILMYHYIGYVPDPEDNLRQRLTVSPQTFRAQIDYLANNGFTPIDLYTLSRAITNRELLPEKPVIITVDDGYVDAYQYAYPILQEYGFTATFFIVTEFVDLGYPAYMNWAMIEEMAAAGMRMEPHTKNHPDLQGRDRAFLIYQILGSLQTLEAHIGYRPRYFAYPGGSYDEHVIEILQELDFWGAVITLGGKWHSFDERYEWRRLRIRPDMPINEFADLVEPVDVLHGVSPGLLDRFMELLP